MLEFIPPLLLTLTGIGLGWSAFQNYRQSETKDIMEGYVIYFQAYLLVTIFFVISALTSGCLPIALAILGLFGYSFAKINNKFSFALFAFPILQIIVYAYISPNRLAIFKILAGAYFVGLPAILIGGILIGYFLQSRYPQIDVRHQNWMRSKVNDITYGFKPIEFMIKETYRLNENSPGQFLPRNAAGGMIVYAAWSTLVGILTWLLLYPTL